MIIRNVPCHANFNTGGRWSRRIVALFRACIPLAIQSITLPLISRPTIYDQPIKLRIRFDPIHSRFRFTLSKLWLWNHSSRGSLIKTFGFKLGLKRKQEFYGCTYERMAESRAPRIDCTGSLWNPFTFPVSRWWMLKYCQMTLFAPYTLSTLDEAISHILLPVGTILYAL